MRSSGFPLKRNAEQPIPPGAGSAILKCNISVDLQHGEDWGWELYEKKTIMERMSSREKGPGK